MVGFPASSAAVCAAASVPAAMPVREWLRDWLDRRADDSVAADVVLTLGPKLLAVCLLAFSVVRLLSSTFRSFLYFQF